GVDRQTDGAAGVGDAARDRLANPPGGIRRELEALAVVELLDGMDKAEVALLHQVEERKLRRLVLLGNRYNKSEIGLDERLRGLVASADRHAQLSLASGRKPLRRLEFLPGQHTGLDRLPQSNLVVLGEQLVFTDVAQVEPNQVLFFALGSLLGHQHT